MEKNTPADVEVRPDTETKGHRDNINFPMIRLQKATKEKLAAYTKSLSQNGEPVSFNDSVSLLLKKVEADKENATRNESNDEDTPLPFLY